MRSGNDGCYVANDIFKFISLSKNLFGFKFHWISNFTQANFQEKFSANCFHARPAYWWRMQYPIYTRRTILLWWREVTWRTVERLRNWHDENMAWQHSFIIITINSSHIYEEQQITKVKSGIIMARPFIEHDITTPCGDAAYSPTEAKNDVVSIPYRDPVSRRHFSELRQCLLDYYSGVSWLYRWFSTRLQYFHCFSYGVTAVLH